MKKFEEKPIVNVLSIIGVSFGILSLLCLFFAWVNMVLLGAFFIGLFITAVFIGIANRLSDIETYTNEFLSYMEMKYDGIKTYQDAYDLTIEFNNLAVKDDRYILAFPSRVKKFHEKLITTLDLLYKLQ